MLGPSYIEQYITQIESSFGLLKFKMRFSAEAAIEKGFIYILNNINRKAMQFIVFSRSKEG